MKKVFYLMFFLISPTFLSGLISQTEICWNRVDDDGDGEIDCLDQDCVDYVFCYECTQDLYQIVNNRFLVTLDIENNRYKDIFSMRRVSEINGAAMNPNDGHVYASAKIYGVNSLVFIGTQGSLGLLGLDLPSDEVYFMGTTDNVGNLYLGNYDTNILKIDLNLPSLEVQDTGIPYPGGTDFAYHYETGFLYGVANDNKLVITNLDNGEVEHVQLHGSINSENGYFGAVWGSQDGYLLAANGTSGKIYSIDIHTLIATEVMNSTGNFKAHDGFNCGAAEIPFEIDCANNIDDDGDGLPDCEDPDCAKSNRCIVEICDNNIDDDGDGFVDCLDNECYFLELCKEICDNNIDDNNDGLIDGEDPTCNTSGGEDGGLESNNRLMSAIAKRNFERAKNNKGFEDFEIMKPSSVEKFNGRSSFDMSMFIPVDAIPETITKITSPTDLTSITNATEVFGADIFDMDRRLATMLLLKTENEIYEHSKFICDRLDGAQIMDISTTFYDGDQLITAEIMQADGRTEYASSFAVYFDADGAHLENHWLNEKYSPMPEVYHFQIWANTVGDLISLVEATFTRIDEYLEITSVETSIPPQVFVTHGKMINGELKLFIKNKNQSTSISFAGKQTETEFSELEDVENELILSGLPKDEITVEMSDIYNVGFRLESENGDIDDLFFADGTWGLNNDESVNTIKRYDINLSDVEPTEGDFVLGRDVSLEISSNNTFSVFRSIGPKFKPVNFDSYNQFSFTAKGNSVVDVILIKEDIVSWEDQPRVSVILGEELETFDIPKARFNLNEDFDWEDIRMIVFEVKNSEQISKEIELELKNLNFNNNAEEIISANIEEGKMKVQPNPFEQGTQYFINSIEEGSYEMKLLDATGKEIISGSGFLVKGVNVFDLEKTNAMIQGVYHLQVVSSQGTLYNEKIMVNN